MYKNKVYRNPVFEMIVQTYWHDGNKPPYRGPVYMRAIKFVRPGLSFAVWWRDQKQSKKYNKPRLSLTLDYNHVEFWHGAIRCRRCKRLWPRDRAIWGNGDPRWEAYAALPYDDRPTMIGHWDQPYGYSKEKGTYVTGPQQWRGPCCESFYPDEYIEDDLFQAMTDDIYARAHNYQVE